MTSLFDQLGLPSDASAIDSFIKSRSPLPPGMVLWEAPFWNSAQAEFLRENLLDDADWAEIIDALNQELRSADPTNDRQDA